MQLSRHLLLVALLLTPIAILSTTWLYLYPIFHGCAFPLPPSTHAVPHAPFRLLALGDPQLEGDSSLPDPHAPIFPSLEYLVPHLRGAASHAARWDVLRSAGREALQDARKWLEGKRKAVDLWGNDWYLAHIVRSLRWWTQPTHIAVLGDLLGSQWITEGEFEKRAGRYWGVVMRGLEMVPRRIFGVGEEEEVAELIEGKDEEKDDGEMYAEDTKDEEEDHANVREEEESHITIVKQEVIHAEQATQDGEPRGESDLEHASIARSSLIEDEQNQGLGNTGEEKREEPSPVEDHDSEKEVQFEVGKQNEVTPTKNMEVYTGDISEGERSPTADLKEEQGGHAEGTSGRGSNLAHALAKHESTDVPEKTSEEQMDKDEPGEQEKGQTSQDQVEEEGHRENEEEKKPLRRPMWGGTTEVLGEDSEWEKRVINIAGNHDVGYAGDLDDYRIERFEKAFGSVNWDIWFTLPENLHKASNSNGRRPDPAESDTAPALRLVVLNSMNLDTPAWNTDLQSETYQFMNHIIMSSRSVEDKTHATVLLTHIPLEKQSGICVDSPYFNFFDQGQGIREQNMLSEFSSKTILQGIYGMCDDPFAAGAGYGRRGIILNGHDHEGCDVMHFLKQDGVLDTCDANTIKKKDAYWPVPMSSTSITESATSTSSMVSIEKTSPANPLLDETSPAPAQYSEPESEEEPEPLKRWRAHRFPHKPYDVVHDARTNTTTCTTINETPHIREITLRSMMGEFSGYAGFLSAWFDPSLGAKGEWVFEMNTCGVGIQHWWWAVHIIDLILVVLAVGGSVTWVVERCKTATSETKANKVENEDKKLMNGNGMVG